MTVREPVHARVDRVKRLKPENAGQFEGILPDQPFDAVHDPWDVAHATDDPRLRKQSYQGWQLRTPGTIGIEDDPVGRDRMIIAGEYPLQEFAFLRFVDEHCRLIAAAHGALQRHKE